MNRRANQFSSLKVTFLCHHWKGRGGRVGKVFATCFAGDEDVDRGCMRFHICTDCLLASLFSSFRFSCIAYLYLRQGSSTFSPKCFSVSVKSSRVPRLLFLDFIFVASFQNQCIVPHSRFLLLRSDVMPKHFIPLTMFDSHVKECICSSRIK